MARATYGHEAESEALTSLLEAPSFDEPLGKAGGSRSEASDS